MSDLDCVFCKIFAGQLDDPGLFWENDDFLAFLTIYPNTEGVTVIASRQHWASDLLSLSLEQQTGFMAAASEVGKKLKAAWEDVGRVGLVMEGLGVDHAHLKLYPLHGTDNWKSAPNENKSVFPKYPGYIVSNNGPQADFEELRQLANRLKNL